MKDNKNDSVIGRILLWPLNTMSESIDNIHSHMDQNAPIDSYMEEDKRAIGLGGALGGCLLTMAWWIFLFVLGITSIICFFVWLL